MRKSLPALAAFGNSAWTAALQFLAVRVYLTVLGVEAYGVIGFFVSLQAVLQVLDVGLAPALNREMARGKALGRLGEARVLLRTLGGIYWGVGLAIAAALAALAPHIAHAWLNAETIAPAELTQAVLLMGILAGCRWPLTAYYNTLVGLGRIGQASLFYAAMTTASIAAAIAAITFIRADLATLFLAQTGVALIAVVALRALAWRELGRSAEARFDWRALAAIWRFSLGMGGVTLTAILLTQLDKILLSRLLGLERFGEYMVAASLTAGLLLLVTPLFGIIFPRFSALVASEDEAALGALYRDGSRLFALAFLPLVLVVALYGQELVTVWTGRPDTAARAAPIVLLLALGYAINGIMFFPYSLQLALGLSRLPLMINGALLVLMVPLVLVLTSRYGAIGGAGAWPVLQFIYLFVGTIVTHRHAGGQGSAGRWIMRSVAVPFALAGAVIGASRAVAAEAGFGVPGALACASGAVIVSWGLALTLFPAVRSAFLAFFSPRASSLLP